MILSLILILAALGIVLLLLYLEGGRSSGSPAIQDLSILARPVDIDAFRNLVDPAEEDFLRVNLSPREFRAVQRERLRAAVDYIRSAARHATELLRLGEAAASQPDARIAQAGRQLVESAAHLRLLTLLVLAQLCFRIALPTTRLSYARLVDRYQRLSGLAGQLIVMQRPSQSTPFSTTL